MKPQPPKRSAEEMVKRVITDPKLEQQVRDDPIRALTALADQVVREMALPPAVEEDVWIYRSVVWALGAALVMIAGGAIYLTYKGIGPIPDVLTALGSAALGALAGLLAPSPTATRR